MAERKITTRMCVGCGEHKAKNELIRIVRTSSGEICLDFTGKLNGRGTYICKCEDCLKKAIKSKRIDSAFKMSVPAEIYEKLEKELANGAK